MERKATVLILRATDWRDCIREKLTWLKKEKLKRESESFLIRAENNGTRTNYFKAKIDDTRQNSEVRLCRDRDEMINHIISECSNEHKDNIRLDKTGRKSDLLKIVQEIEIWPYYWMLYAQTGMQDTNRSLNPGQKTRSSDNLKKKEPAE